MPSTSAPSAGNSRTSGSRARFAPQAPSRWPQRSGDEHPGAPGSRVPHSSSRFLASEKRQRLPQRGFRRATSPAVPLLGKACRSIRSTAVPYRALRVFGAFVSVLGRLRADWDGLGLVLAWKTQNTGLWEASQGAVWRYYHVTVPVCLHRDKLWEAPHGGSLSRNRAARSCCTIRGSCGAAASRPRRALFAPVSAPEKFYKVSARM